MSNPAIPDPEEHRFWVKVFTVDQTTYPAVIEYDDLDQAILQAWLMARHSEVWYTNVIAPLSHLTIAAFNLKFVTSNELVLIPVEKEKTNE